MTRAVTSCVLAVAVLLGVTERPAQATVPSETLLPATTKAFISTSDLAKTKAQWNLTDLGRLVNDPIMQPFVEDLRQQLEGKRDEGGIRLGVSAEELEAIAGGEVAWAVIQPGQDKRAHARMVVADVTGHREEAAQLLVRIGRNLTGQGAVRSDFRVGAMQIVAYKLPAKRGSTEARALYHLLHEDLLVTSDHEGEMRALIARMAAASKDSLSGVRAFQQAMLRSKVAMGTQESHLRWFVEPLGYLQVSRVMRGEERRRGTDLLQVLRNQGFDAIEGVGGLIALKTSEHEILHKSLIYAPGNAQGERFELAARMLQFPNGPTVPPPVWVPEGVANLLSWNWKMEEAFEYSKSLVNELAGAKAGEDLFEDIIGSIRDDVAGPRVDLRKDLVKFLDDRALVVTDYRMPISPESERLLVAVKLTDTAKVAETIRRIMEADPDALPRQVVTADGKPHVVWEIVNEQPEEVEEIKIVGAGFGPQGGPDPDEEEEEEEEERTLPNMAVTVAHDHLLVASHVDFVADVLKQANPAQALAAARDYQRISQTLDQLGGQKASFRFFTRTDEAYRPTYELIRQGRMPESETLTGKLLNRLFGPNEKGVVRPQEIDGSKMPPYDQVKSYLGPAGIFITTVDDGWFMTGFLLKSQTP